MQRNDFERFTCKSMEELDALIQPQPRVLNRLRHFRSALMLSAHNTEHLSKIERRDADCIVLNLEDGVAKEHKPLALRYCAYVLSQLRACRTKLVVRVNALDEGGADEIRYLNAFEPDAIRIPKVRTVADVDNALELLDETIELHLSIETKEAWLELAAFGRDERVTACYLGILDLFADLQLPQELIEPNNPTLQAMLAHFLITCKSVGVEPVSFVFQDYHNMKRFKEWLALERRMGYRSKGCLSPSQATLVNEAFAFDDAAIARAQYIAELFEAKRQEGVCGFSDAQVGFVDEPVYKGALALLRLAGVAT